MASTVSPKDPKDFMFSNIKNKKLIKKPGDINGLDFVIDELENCEVYLLDHLSSVIIDYCKNTKFFIGPIDGSIFLRNCENCTITVACRQFRCRECMNCDVYLYCATKSPIIESSGHIRFHMWNGAYDGLTQHFEKAKLDPQQNYWNSIHDFTPNQEGLLEPHYQIIDTLPPIHEIQIPIQDQDHNNHRTANTIDIATAAPSSPKHDLAIDTSTSTSSSSAAAAAATAASSASSSSSAPSSSSSSSSSELPSLEDFAASLLESPKASSHAPSLNPHSHASSSSSSSSSSSVSSSSELERILKGTPTNSAPSSPKNKMSGILCPLVLESQVLDSRSILEEFENEANHIGHQHQLEAEARFKKQQQEQIEAQQQQEYHQGQELKMKKQQEAEAEAVEEEDDEKEARRKEKDARKLKGGGSEFEIFESVTEKEKEKERERAAKERHEKGESALSEQEGNSKDANTTTTTTNNNNNNSSNNNNNNNDNSDNGNNSPKSVAEATDAWLLRNSVFSDPNRKVDDSAYQKWESRRMAELEERRIASEKRQIEIRQEASFQLKEFYSKFDSMLEKAKADNRIEEALSEMENKMTDGIERDMSWDDVLAMIKPSVLASRTPDELQKMKGMYYALKAKSGPGKVD